VFLSAAAVPAFDYSFLVSDNTKQARLDFHRQIVARTATAPERYRVLAPYLLEGPIRAIGGAMPYEDAVHRVYAAFYFLALAAILATLFWYLTFWFRAEQALVGALLVAATMPIALRHHAYAPYSLLEPGFVATALVLMLQERRVLLAVLVAVATANRETAIFLVLLYVATMRWSRRDASFALAYFAIWAAVFVGVRTLAGGAARYWDLATVWYGNTHSVENMVTTAVNVSRCLGFFWMFAALGFRRAPWFIKRSAAVTPFYCVTVAIWGLWWEVRLLMPLYPLVLPLALSYMFGASEQPSGHNGSQQRMASDR
jgi:hypothetical protein